VFPGLGRLYGRWTRSGVAPRRVYAGAGIAFAALAVIAAVRGDIAVAVIAVAVGVLATGGGLWLNAALGREPHGRDGENRE